MWEASSVTDSWVTVWMCSPDSLSDLRLELRFCWHGGMERGTDDIEGTSSVVGSVDPGGSKRGMRIQGRGVP